MPVEITALPGVMTGSGDTPVSSRRAEAGATRLRLVHSLISTALFFLACWQFFGALGDRPMHRDETRWIHRAAYIRELMHPFSNYWDEETWIANGDTLDERYRLRAQPPMGSYVTGIGFLLQGQDLPNIGFWNMDQDDA